MECEMSIGRIFTILMNLTSCIHESVNLSNDESIKVNETLLINLIEILHYLVRLVVIRILISPSEEHERASSLVCAFVNGRRSQEEAENLQKILEMGRIKQTTSINKIQGEIEEERKLLEKTKSQDRQEFDCEIHKLEEQPNRIENATMIKTRQMEEMMKANEIEYQNTCKCNIICEKELAAMRRKVQHHYLEILAKYDRDVGELHRTMKSLMEKTNSLLNKLKKVEGTLALQEIQYDKLETERKTMIRAVFLENLTKLMNNRAAKIIQRTWRSYWERQQLRKKKKGKKKKQ